LTWAHSEDLANLKSTAKTIDGSINKAKFLDSNSIFIRNFEEAIDYLRRGDLYYYNYLARKQGFAEIKQARMHLPILFTEDYLQNLEPYVALANYQDEKAK
jgi:hypothetical protein